VCNVLDVWVVLLVCFSVVCVVCVAIQSE
jgi:hypothetical protein